MSTYCVVTKLIGSVVDNNYELDYLNDLKVTADMQSYSDNKSGSLSITQLTIESVNNKAFAPTASSTDRVTSNIKTAYLMDSGKYVLKINNFKDATQLSIRCTSPNKIEADYNRLQYCTSLTSITLTGNANYVGGDITLFGALISLNTLNIGSNPVCFGAIEDLAEAQVENGRISGELAIIGNGIITYNGTTFTNTKTIIFDSSLPNGYNIT